MAKGNMMQGMARGAVGDIVFYRMNGEQMTRVRNRHPHNPNTDQQLYQRAIVSTAMQLYSAGKEIFDHAFEGKSVGADAQRYFMRVNCRYLRQRLTYEIDNQITPRQGRDVHLGAPGIAQAVPSSGIMISDGSIDQAFFKITPASLVTGSELNEGFAEYQNETSQTKTLKEYAEENGLIADDLYTFIWFVEDIDHPAYIYPEGLSDEIIATCYFEFLRYRVKDLSQSTVLCKDAVWSDLVEIMETSYIKNDWLSNAIFSGSEATMKIMYSQYFKGTILPYGGCWGIIKSRVNSPLRSRSFLQNGKDFWLYGMEWPSVLPVWRYEQTQQGGGLSDSDLILEGGE